MKNTSLLPSLVDHFLNDPIPKLIGFAFITGWLWFIGSAALKAEAVSIWGWLLVILVAGLVTAIIAIISGIWWTPTYHKGGGPDD